MTDRRENTDLTHVGKRLPYTVPDGFFEQLQSDVWQAVQSDLHRPRARRPLRHCLAWGIAGGVAAALALGFFLYPHPEPPQGFRGLVSRSCHSLEELEEHAADDYLFLSPIFDSISKVGYTARFTAESLLEAAARGIVNDRVLALGGVRPEYLPRIRAYGFGGAALMGCIWQAADAGTLSATLGAIRKYRNEE